MENPLFEQAIWDNAEDLKPSLYARKATKFDEACNVEGQSWNATLVSKIQDVFDSGFNNLK